MGQLLSEGCSHLKENPRALVKVEPLRRFSIFAAAQERTGVGFTLVLYSP